MLRIIDKETYFFIRDDFTHDPDTELALDVEPAQGLYKPKWTGEITEDDDGNLIASQDGEWVEGATPEEIEELTKPQPYEPSEIDKLKEELAQANEISKSTSLALTELIFMTMSGGM